VHVGATIARRFVLDSEDSYDLVGVQRFIARDNRLDRFVNVDIVTAKAPSAVVAAAGRARVLRDKRLSRVLAAGRERIDGHHVSYIVTERPGGIHVDELLGRVIFVPAAAAAVVGEAAAALITAAVAGEHHGMVRPQSLFVTDRGRVMVSGMGIDGELAVQSGLSRGRNERADAVALARVFLTAITGRDADAVTVADLPDDLSPAAAKFAKAAIKGSGPKKLADVTAALGVGDTKLLRSMATEAPSLWWPAAPVVAPQVVEVVAAPPVAMGPAARQGAPAPVELPARTAPPTEVAPPTEAEPATEVAPPTEAEPPTEVEPEAPPDGPQPSDYPTMELSPITEDILDASSTDVAPARAMDEAAVVTGEIVTTDVAQRPDDLIEAEIVRTDEIPVARPRTRFGGAVDDIDEFHDIVDEQNRETKPTVAEVSLLWLRERFPDNPTIERAAEAAHRRAELQAPINPGPLLLGLGLVTLFIIAVMALSSIGQPFDPDFERYNNPQATYPAYTFGPDGPSPTPSP
jgi:hypothetical protein